MVVYRRLVFLVVAIVTVILAGGVWLLWPHTSRAISRENFERIQLGMTLAEVEAVMGEKADLSQAGNWKGAAGKPGENTHAWASAADGLIMVVTRDDRVTDKGFQPADEMPITQRIGIWWVVR